MTTYYELDTLLHHSKTGKPVPSRKIGNNTYAQRRGEAIAVRLHDTDILTFTPKATGGYDVTIDTGGWLTVTTKDRINTHLPAGFRLKSDNGRWRLLETFEYEGYWYQDGMKIHLRPNRTLSIVTGFLPTTDRERADRHNRQMNKLIDRYLRNWTDSKHAEMLADDSKTPPCSLCIWTHEGLIGERMGDTQHLIEHLMDKHLPRTVWVRAVEVSQHRHTVALSYRTLAVRVLRKYLRGQLYVQHTTKRMTSHAA